MAGIDFKLNASGDIELVDGNFTLLSTIQEAVRQRLQVKYKTFKGEWFLNTLYGIPYFEGTYGGTFYKGILGKGYSKSEVDAIFLQAANEDADVIRVTRFNSTLNSYTRLYDVDIEVLTTDGLIRITAPSITPNDEIDYPIPPEFVVSPDCGADSIPMDGVFIDNTAPLGVLLPNDDYTII